MKTGVIIVVIGGCLIIVLCLIIIVLLIQYKKDEKVDDVKIKVNGGKEITEKHSSANDLIMDFVGIEDEVEHTVCFMSESDNKKNKGSASVPDGSIEDEDITLKKGNDAFSEKRIRLTDVKNNRIFEIQIRAEIIIGRLNQEGKSNFIEIDYDRSISRVHCKIERIRNEYYLSDLGSANHVFINNSILKGTVEILSGQILILGNVKLMFEVL